MIEFTLYGQTYGSPNTMMSDLAVDLDELLLVQLRERPLVHGLDLAGVDAGHAVRRLDPPVQIWWRIARRRHVVRLLRGEVRRPARTSDHSHSRLFMKPNGSGNVSLLSVVSIWKIFSAARGQQSPIRVARVVDRAVARPRVHVRLRVQHRVDVVVVLHAAVAREADRHGLVAAVHRDEVDVHVDDQVGLRRALVDLDLLALVGRRRRTSRLSRSSASWFFRSFG